jgi:dienelactone hydrolase
MSGAAPAREAGAHDIDNQVPPVPRRAWRYGRRALVTFGAFVAMVLVVAPVGAAYVLTHVARPPVDHIDLGTANVQDATLETSDGLTLRGSYVPSRNGAAVIVAFGRAGTQKHARMLVRHGYGVLIFDRRGEGRSDGDPNQFAWDEGERDMNAAIDYLKSRPDVEPGRIGGLGLSVGGETFLQTAARNGDIQAIVAEGASSRSSGELASLPDASLRAVLGNTPTTVATAVFSDAAPPEHLIDQVDEIAPRDLFLIYAKNGTAGEERKANPAFLRAAHGRGSIWEIPEAEHVGGLKARPREYEQRVTRFLDGALLGEGRS